MRLFVTGIGTNVGKTIVSAVLTEALQADYWKPVQSGYLEGKDSDTVKSLITNTRSTLFPESYLLKAPLSPHFAAQLEDTEIQLDKLALPETQNHLIIEGAGGILVPLNHEHYVIDMAARFNCGVILVIADYLGCINHSLLSISYLKQKTYRIEALVFNGDFEPPVKQAILDVAPEIPYIDVPYNLSSREAVRETAQKIAPLLLK